MVTDAVNQITLKLFRMTSHIQGYERLVAPSPPKADPKKDRKSALIGHKRLFERPSQLLPEKTKMLHQETPKKMGIEMG